MYPHTCPPSPLAPSQYVTWYMLWHTVLWIGPPMRMAISYNSISSEFKFVILSCTGYFSIYLHVCVCKAFIVVIRHHIYLPILSCPFSFSSIHAICYFKPPFGAHTIFLLSCNMFYKTLFYFIIHILSVSFTWTRYNIFTWAKLVFQSICRSEQYVNLGWLTQPNKHHLHLNL